MSNLRIGTLSFIAARWDKFLAEKTTKAGCLASIILLAILVAIPQVDLYLGLLRLRMRLGIQPTVPALQSYLSEVLTPQMPQAEVNNILHSMGARVAIRELKREGEACDSIGFFIGYWPLNRLDYLICYDHNLRLRSVTSRDPS